MGPKELRALPRDPGRVPRYPEEVPPTTLIVLALELVVSRQKEKRAGNFSNSYALGYDQ